MKFKVGDIVILKERTLSFPMGTMTTVVDAFRPSLKHPYFYTTELSSEFSFFEDELFLYKRKNHLLTEIFK